MRRMGIRLFADSEVVWGVWPRGRAAIRVASQGLGEVLGGCGGVMMRGYGEGIGDASVAGAGGGARARGGARGGGA